MKMRILAVPLALLLLAGAACSEDPEEEEAEAAMSVSLEAFDFRFDTTTIPVELGAVVEVTLLNSGAVAHSFSVPDLDVELEVEPGDSASVNFAVPEDPGAYQFFCKFHPDDMTGSLTVGGEGVPPGSDTDPDDVNDPEDVEEDDDADVDVEVETT
jgi:plastocyanin